MSGVTEAAREFEALSVAALASETLAADLENAALERGEDIDLADITGHREKARGLRFKARSAARKAERESEAARLAALADLHADILAAAEGFDVAPVICQLDVIRLAAQEFARLLAGHDAGVAALAGRARALGCTTPAPGGPRAADGHVALGADGGIVAGPVTIARFGERADDLPAAAASGGVPVLPVVVVTTSERARPKFLMYSTRSGGLFSADRIGPGQAGQIERGDLVALGAADIDAFMAGVLEVTPEIIDAARERQGSHLAACKGG